MKYVPEGNWEIYVSQICEIALPLLYLRTEVKHEPLFHSEAFTKI